MTVRLAHLIRRENISIVHVNDIRYVHVLVGAALGGAVSVCHVRATVDSERIRRFLSWTAVALADEVVCVSERTRDLMFTSVNTSIDTVSVVYDGLPSPERFDELPDGDEFREAYDIDPDAVLIVQVSKLTANKGQDRLLAAAETLKKRGVTEVAFAAVGGTVDGHERYAGRVRRRATEISGVHITGFHENVIEAFTAADCVVHLPRHHDPFPGVVLEAMLAGNPVVASRSGGIPEQVNEGETGFLVPRESGIEAVAEAIERLANDSDRRREMGETARQRVQELFPVEAHFNAIEEIYTRIDPEWD